MTAAETGIGVGFVAEVVGGWEGGGSVGGGGARGEGAVWWGG